jgi:hypothetical protein
VGAAGSFHFMGLGIDKGKYNLGIRFLLSSETVLLINLVIGISVLLKKLNLLNVI